jgi:MiaB-like tRNA modifying enzyme
MPSPLSKTGRVHFKTFGCRTNQFDTQVMMAKLKHFDISADERDADVIVVNSCTVTNGADASVRHYIRQAARKNPDARIVLAGCGSHSKGESLYDADEVFGVMGHSEKEHIDDLLGRTDRFYEIGDLEHIDSTIVTEFVGKSRAFIKIQEGCNFACSYCIIPAVRGGARSYPIVQIEEQVRVLAANGFGEFILTGTNVGSYGQDIGTSMAEMLRRLSRLRGVRRIRIGSLEPIQIDAPLMELLDEPWMARHLHIALQHTSDAMLSRMNRRNAYASDVRLFEHLAERGYALGTDFIVGHPGEGEDEWREAMERIDTLPLTHIHAFTYSQRDGTASATMRDIVRGDIAKARHRELTERIAAKNHAFRQAHTDGLIVLVENGQDGLYNGLDQYFNRVRIRSEEDLSGNWISINGIEPILEGNRADFGPKQNTL